MKKEIILVDNYDSFTHNLGRFVELALQQCFSFMNFDQMSVEICLRIVRNDDFSAKEILDLNPIAIIFSPGPGSPCESGCCRELLKIAPNQLPILGVCLGHQIIIEHFGGTIVKGAKPMHGKISSLSHVGKGVFKNIATPINVARYHSLVSGKRDFPDELIIDAISADGEIMAVSHESRPIWGLQFHPESAVTEFGQIMMNNFISEVITLSQLTQQKFSLSA